VRAGIFTETDVQAFRRHVALVRRSPLADDEGVRLIGGFNDIFVVIACCLLLNAVGIIGGLLAAPIGAAFVALTAWGLAEFFTRKRRMALPSIVLAVAFVGAIIWSGVTNTHLYSAIGARTVVAASLAVVGSWLYWWRFRVPVSVAAGAAAVSNLVLVVLLATVRGGQEWGTVVVLFCGCAVFAAAMAWDRTDTRRETTRSDVAFWLHLLAAPMLVHPVFSLTGIAHGSVFVARAVLVVVLYLIIAIISLSIDRRALMVSALAYVLITFTTLIGRMGAGRLGFALTALAIGSALLVLSIFWQPCRRFVVARLPQSVRRQLPAA
jgi:hypothetical protein